MSIASAKALFVSLLTPDQRLELEQCGRVTVDSSGGHRYVIRTGQGITDNVSWVHDDGRRGGILCGSLGFAYPSWDTFLAQKLMIETDELRFVALAFGRAPPWHPALDRVRRHLRFPA